jgi:predicted O-methyltransferase YrrM
VNLLSASRKLATMGAVLLRHPREARFAHLWLRSLLPGHNPLEDELPWITFRAIQWLLDYLQPQMRAFEYGAGGSTLFLAKRVRELISVEHDEAFHSVVADRLAKSGIQNCRLVLCRPETLVEGQAEAPYGTDSFTSFQSKYRGRSFENYVKAIDEYPNGYFDLVLVDGRARASCVRRALRKVRQGGALLLDNSERPAYGAARSLLSGNPCLDLFGVVPWNLVPYQTSVWRIENGEFGAASDNAPPRLDST